MTSLFKTTLPRDKYTGESFTNLNNSTNIWHNSNFFQHVYRYEKKLLDKKRATNLATEYFLTI
jgi:hypothetical protein